MTDEKLTVIKSSGNIFADIGLPNPEKHLAKAQLAIKINNIIEQRGLTQKQAAVLLGVEQSEIAALACGRLSGFSTECLIGLFHRLAQIKNQHKKI